MGRHTHHIAHQSIDVACHQETDIMEHLVGQVAANLGDVLYNVAYAEPISISKDNVRRGRRATILSRSRTVDLSLTHSDNNLALLKASGRWVERFIPTGKGDRGFIVASVYGYSSASGHQPTYKANEALLAAAVVRTLQFTTTP